MNKHPSILSSVFTVSRISALLGFFVPALAVSMAVSMSVGCDSNRQGGPGSPAEVEENGQALLTVGTIPDDVTCVIVTVAGDARTAARSFDVQGGDTLSESLTGLPVGAVVFSADAYAQACSTVTKSTSPTWLSEDKDVTLVQGKSSSVTLTLYKNGRAKVSVQFADQEDGGTDAGARDGATSD